MEVSLRSTAGAVLVVSLHALSCAPASPTTGAPAPVSTATQPVEFESTRGAYSFEFVTEQVITSDTIAASPGAAWVAIHRAYADVGLPRGEVREGTTTYGIPRATVRRSLAGVPLSRFMRCGTTMGVPNADSYDVTLSMITRLVPLGQTSTIVQSQLAAHARQTGVASNPLPCTTTRELERRVSRLIEYHAANR